LTPAENNGIRNKNTGDKIAGATEEYSAGGCLTDLEISQLRPGNRSLTVTDITCLQSLTEPRPLGSGCRELAPPNRLKHPPTGGVLAVRATIL